MKKNRRLQILTEHSLTPKIKEVAEKIGRTSSFKVYFDVETKLTDDEIWKLLKCCPDTEIADLDEVKESLALKEDYRHG